MPIELITGTAGYAHVDSADVGAFNAATLGSGSYIMSGGGCTMPNVNTARIAAAELMVQGRHVRLTGQGVDATIDNGEVGKNRNDIVCAHYTKALGIEGMEISVLKGTAVVGTPSDPDIPSGSIMAGDAEAWVPMYRIKLIALVPQTPERMISLSDNIPLIDHKHSASDVTSGTLAISRGGTGASSASAALSNLGAASSSHKHSASDITSGTLGVARGGTGVTTNAEIGLKAYPVGAIYIAYNSTSPASRFGGTWTQITGKFLRADNGTGTGGSDTHTLTVAQMPAHYHGLHVASVSAATSESRMLGIPDSAGSSDMMQHTGGGGSHNNMPAYQNVYAWRRTE